MLSTITSLLAGGLEHQPSPRGWAEASLVGPTQNGWAGPDLFFSFFVKKKTSQKYGLGFLQFPRALVMLFLIKIDCIFKSLKIPSFCQKKKFVHLAKSLKA